MISQNMLWERYIILDKIGKGTFGEVYKTNRFIDNKNMAMKVERRDIENPRLQQEYKIYKKIISKGCRQGIPRVYEFIKTPNYHIMTMELLGKNLEELFEDNDCHLSVSSVLYLGIDIINIIRNIHSVGFIHRDIKPNNFMIGLRNKTKIYLMDFGLSKEFIKNNGIHIKETFDHSVIGTARYSSINMHMGFEPSRRDDLEAIGYMLIYFIKGKLPWQGICRKRDKNEIFEKIGNVKMSTSIEKLCDGLQPCFQQYIEYCRNLKFDEVPDYHYLINLFNNTIKQNNYIKKYEWIM
jgi:serine/threonine protein kinase